MSKAAAGRPAARGAAKAAKGKAKAKAVRSTKAAKPKPKPKPKPAARAAAGAGKRGAGHGGRREGSGRKPKLDERGQRVNPPRPPRVHWRGKRTLLATLHVELDVPNLRKGKCAVAARESLTESSERTKYRVLALGVEPKKVLAVLEADSLRELSNAMKGLASRLARRINRELGRDGAVVRGRYEAVTLESAADVKRAVAKVSALAP